MGGWVEVVGETPLSTYPLPSPMWTSSPAAVPSTAFPLLTSMSIMLWSFAAAAAAVSSFIFLFISAVWCGWGVGGWVGRWGGRER